MIYSTILKKRLLFAASIAFLITSSCTKIEGVGLEAEQNLLAVNSSDTFAVSASTFLLDPLPSAGQGGLLVGAFENEYVGQTRASTYFRLAVPDLSTTFTNDVQFDSLTISFFYNGYSYGDTTQTMGISVHRLSQAIDPKELSIALEGDEFPVFASGETLYTDQEFAYAREPLGTTRFSPKPHSKKDTVSIKLDQNLGHTLFGMVLSKDSRLTVEDDFLDFFRGLAIISEPDAKAIVGFKDSIAFSLHYSYERQSDGRRITEELTINMGNSDYQYNRIETERSNSLLRAMTAVNSEIVSTSTDSRTFVQGLTGLVSRIRFPGIRETLGLGATAINKAQLIIETDQLEYGFYPPPDSLILFVANRYGTPTSLVKNASGASLLAVYQQGSTSGGIGRGKYVFDISNYLSALIKTQTYDDEESLLISLPTTTLLSRTNVLQVAQNDNKPAIKLNVLYIKTQ
ncbi:hypothetical protein GCM10017764_33800 [Sphingobacterium griseoflavum]|uniref:DUF4270 domain-containing protein n=2 Tax=Sphingobacterium griseoflavum TaxID=1474952 RepID=A0ABQ3I3V3_9SPHI|nr:hypothetical protein GCM10017764_33800 [Sphingobacterium griseoflavum]